MNKQVLVLALLVLFCSNRILGADGEGDVAQENPPTTDQEVKPEDTTVPPVQEEGTDTPVDAVKTNEVKTEETPPAEVKTDEVKPEEKQPDEVKPEETKPEEVKADEVKPEENKPVEANHVEAPKKEAAKPELINSGTAKSTVSLTPNDITIFGHHFEKKVFRVYLIGGLGILILGGIVMAFCLGKKKD